MRKAICILAVLFISACATEQEQKKIHSCVEIPYLSLKLLAESTIDPCSICAKKLKRQAFSIIDEQFQPGRVLVFYADCAMLTTEQCDKNEFMISSYTGGEYITAEDGAKVAFPTLVFKFHTESNHLVGIKRPDYTEKSVANTFNSFKKNEDFTGKVVIIPYEYGDGAAANYFSESNTLVIHVKLVSLGSQDPNE